MKLRHLTAWALLAFAAFSCSDSDPDVEKPAIVSLTVGEKEGDEYVAHVGEPLLIKGTFTDNEGLKSYKIDLHPNFDGHDHARLSEEDFGWRTSQVFLLDGKKSATISNEEILVPEYLNKDTGAAWKSADGAAKKVAIPTGDYHVMVFVLDQEGNEEKKVFSLHVHGEEHDHDHD